MNSTLTTRSLFVLAGAALLAQATPARADVTKAQCVDALTNAQSLRRQGKFTESRAELAVCNDAACPALVRDECTRQADALAQEQPTVVFDAKTPDGKDLSAVQVTVDQKPVADKLDGTPIAVDRGAHAFTFVTDGQAPVTLELVIKDAEKQRRVSVTLGPTQATGTEDKHPTPPPPANDSRKTLGYVAGGAGAVGVGVGVLFGFLAASKWNSSKNECAQTACPSYSQAVSDHSSAVTDATISTVGVVAGLALLGAGAAILLTTPRATDSAPAVGVGPGSVVLSGRF